MPKKKVVIGNFNKTKVVPYRATKDVKFQWCATRELLETGNGDFSWKKVSSEDILCKIVKKLQEKEQVSFDEALQTNHCHPKPVSQLAKPMKKKMEALNVTSLYQIQIEGRHRVYGTLRNGKFHLIYNDALHKICNMS